MSAAVPKVIWTYWDEPKPPQVVVGCLRVYLDLNGWELRWMHRESAMVAELLERDGPPGAAALSPEAFSDWLRLHLLRAHGGCWLDASMFVDDASLLDALRDAFDDGAVEAVAYRNHNLKPERGSLPALESALIMAPPGSPFIAAWCDEFDRAIAVGFDVYCAAAKAPVQHILDHNGLGTYLTVFVAAQEAMHARGAPPSTYLHTPDAHRGGMFTLRRACKFEPVPLRRALADYPRRSVAGITKLTSMERELLTQLDSTGRPVHHP